MFIGAAGPIALPHLPGLPIIDGVGPATAPSRTEMRHFLRIYAIFQQSNLSNSSTSPAKSSEMINFVVGEHLFTQTCQPFIGLRRSYSRMTCSARPESE
jgi:hypothetical protein